MDTFKLLLTHLVWFVYQECIEMKVYLFLCGDTLNDKVFWLEVDALDKDYVNCYPQKQ